MHQASKKRAGDTVDPNVLLKKRKTVVDGAEWDSKPILIQNTKTYYDGMKKGGAVYNVGDFCYIK